MIHVGEDISYPETPETFATSLKLLEDGKQLAICHMGFRFDAYSRWCGHNCSYCYARSIESRFKRWSPDNIRIADLGQVKKHFSNVYIKKKPKLNLVESCIAHRYPIRAGTNTDCFQPAEKKYRITYRFIDEIMNRYDYPFTVCTKSDLVCDPEYLALYGDNVNFQFTLSTLDADLLAKIEVEAPPPSARLRAMNTLSNRGFFVGCRISPHIPEFMNDLPELVGALAENGCSHVISELLRISPILNKVMVEDCGFDVTEHYRSMGVKLNLGYFRYPLDRKIRYQKELKELCDKHGMTFATCADEDPSFHTVENCCGFDKLSPFVGCPQATYDTAFRICRDKGEVTFEDLLEAGWCPNPEGLQEVWDKGYFENILMNLEFVPERKSYRFVTMNKTMRRVNLSQSERSSQESLPGLDDES